MGKHTKDELRILQALPLEVKVMKTKQRIREWYNHWGGAVYVSFSGGKDSTVLLRLAREIYPNIEGVFVNTGLEYPEIQMFVQSFENIRTLYPKVGFREVISTYGYPVISKTVSHNVGILKRNPNGKVEQNSFNPAKRGPFAMEKWRPISLCDFDVSEKCCDIMKKRPAHEYSKSSGKQPITAQMAQESKLRKSKWIEYGCNAFDTEYPVSNPMSFWTDQDVLLYIKLHKIPIASVYGEVVYDCEDPEQERFDGFIDLPLKTTGCHRTGCIYCGFGCHLEKSEDRRFISLASTHPRQYNFCINGGGYDENGLWKPDNEGLGLGHVFDALNEIYGKDFIRYK